MPALHRGEKAARGDDRFHVSDWTWAGGFGWGLRWDLKVGGTQNKGDTEKPAWLEARWEAWRENSGGLLLLRLCGDTEARKTSGAGRGHAERGTRAGATGNRARLPFTLNKHTCRGGSGRATSGMQGLRSRAAPRRRGGLPQSPSSAHLTLKL